LLFPPASSTEKMSEGYLSNNIYVLQSNFNNNQANKQKEKNPIHTIWNAGLECMSWRLKKKQKNILSASGQST